MNLFYELHNNIPREGPGNNESTKKAYQIIEKLLPTRPLILEIGCGPGMQTIELASLTSGTIVAADLNEGFLAVLQEKVEKYGLQNKVTVEKANMKSLPYSEGQFDVIWSEGAVFIIGFQNGLKEWKQYLKENGILVVSELSWLKSNAPDEPVDFWNHAYPEADTINGNNEKAEKLGYEVIDTFVLPEEGWWEHYYNPLEKKISQLRGKYHQNSEALKSLDEFQKEVDLYRQYSDYYGYVFYILRKK
ncbi:MAG: class I SAM-dependent methyltransferase [Neobacillus sp.]